MFYLSEKVRRDERNFEIKCMAAESEEFAAKLWSAERSVYGDLCYVKRGTISLSEGKEGARKVEFRKCTRTRAKRSLKFLALLTFLDLAVSTALQDHYLVIHTLFIALLVLHILFSLALSVYKEEVVIVEGFGVQISSTTWLGWNSTVFLPCTIVGDIIINEGVKMCHVVFYLAVTVVAVKKKEENRDTANTRHQQSTQIIKLYPLFTEFHPRLSVIEESYHFLRHCLHLPSSPRQPLL